MQVLIVGGGISGLTAANLWLDRGATVTLAEKGTPGGRGRTVVRDGGALNLGAHALYAHGHARRVLAGLGIEPVGARPTVGSVVVDGGVYHPMPLGPWTLLRSGAAADARLALARLFVSSSGPAGVSVRAWFDELGLRGAARRTAEAFVRVATYAHAPDLLDAAEVGEQIALAAKGVLYLHGGWQTLVDALLERGRDRGLTVERATITGLHDNEDSVQVEGLEGRWDAVVVAVPPAAAKRLVPMPDGLVPARAATLDMVWESVPSPHHGFALGGDEPFYFSVTSQTADLGPRPVVQAMAYLAPGETVERGRLERWIDGLQPGWRDQVRHARWMPSLEVTGALPTVAVPRPPVDVSPRVACCGDAYGNRGMLLDAGMASAEEAVELLSQRLQRLGSSSLASSVA